MTEKQEKILESALELFATNGYDGTSTSKVAARAGVSEGLIFRHFGNKEGLLQAIMTMGLERLNHLLDRMRDMESPKDVLRAIIDLPFTIAEEEHNYWRLVYGLKWQAATYDDNMFKALKDIIHPAFDSLEYENPMAETELLLAWLDGVAMAILLRHTTNLSEMRSVMMNKYNL